MSNWYDPQQVANTAHLVGPLSSVFNGVGDVFSGSGGRTCIGTHATDQATGSGTITRVKLLVSTATAGNNWKVVVYRPNAGNYDFVGQSEAFDATVGSTRDLQTPITGVQTGDVVGVWMADINQAIQLTGISGRVTKYITGNPTGAGNDFAGSLADETVSVEGIVLSGGTSVASVRWGGFAQSAWNRTNHLGGGRTFITGIVPHRCIQDGSIAKILMDVFATGSADQVKFKVFRPNGSNYDLISASETVTPAGTGLQTFTLGTPMACQPGDVLGVWIGDDGTTAIGLSPQTAGSKYLDGDITGNGNNFSNVLAYNLNLEAQGINPFLATTGDSISVGHGTPNYESMLDGDGPSGTLAHAPGAAIKALVGGTFAYQNLGKGGQPYSWVANTAFPGFVLPAYPTAIWMHAGILNVTGASSWNTAKASLDSIYGQLSAANPAQHLFMTEALPDSNLNDTDASGTPANDDAALSVTYLNSKLATWVSGKTSATLISAHVAFGQTRVSTGLPDDLKASYDSGDGLHLNQAGTDALAALVEAALVAYYNPTPVAGTLSQTSVTSTSAELSYATVTSGTPPYSNQLRRSLISGSGYSNIGSPVVGATAIYLDDEPLTPATDYYYIVVTTDNASQTATSNEVHVTTSAAPAVDVQPTRPTSAYMPSFPRIHGIVTKRPMAEKE